MGLRKGFTAQSLVTQDSVKNEVNRHILTNGITRIFMCVKKTYLQRNFLQFI